MILSELFNGQHALKVVSDTNTKFEAEVAFGKKVIRYEAIADNTEGSWEVAFGELDEFGNTQIGMMGTGKEFEVLAAAKKFIEVFNKHKQPKHIHFSSFTRDASRVKVYERMLKRLCPSDFRFSVENHGVSTHFSMTKEADTR